jgi:hypothetical protein
MKTRVIKKNNAYYPQYLKTWWFGKYKKWMPYTFTMSYLICSGYAEDTELEMYFDTKLEALHFIKRDNI